MPALKRKAEFDDKLELVTYLSSCRDLMEKLNKLKEKNVTTEKSELNKIQEIEAEQNKQNIQKSNGTTLISKIVNGLLFVLLQLEISLKEIREYIKQYEVNNEIISKKIKQEIEEMIHILNRMLESSLKEYYAMQKRKEEIKQEMEQLIINITIINKRLDQIWKEQHLIVSNMIVNLDQVINISIGIGDKQIPISFSMREVRDEIQRNAFSERNDHLKTNTPESILSHSMMKLFIAHVTSIHKLEIVPNVEITKASIICDNLAIEEIQTDPNKIINQSNFYALENEKVQHIKNKETLTSSLNNLQDENLDIISSMKNLEFVLQNEFQKINTILQHIEIEFASSLDLEVKNHMLVNDELPKTNTEADKKFPPLETKHETMKDTFSDIATSIIENTLPNVAENKDNKEHMHNAETKTQEPRRKRIKAVDTLKTTQENSEQKVQENSDAKSLGLLAATGLFISRPSQNTPFDKSQQPRTIEKASNDSTATPDKDAPALQQTPRRTF